MKIENFDALKAALDQKIPNKVCPMCGQAGKMELEDSTYLLMSPNVDNGQIHFEGSIDAIESACLTCLNCGHLFLFSPKLLLQDQSK